MTTLSADLDIIITDNKINVVPGIGDTYNIVVTNFGPIRGQCYVHLPWADLQARKLLFCDLLSPARYERDGDELVSRGLYLDMPEWGHHVFEISSA